MALDFSHTNMPKKVFPKSMIVGKQAGFTLIEMMAALAVVAVAVGAAISLVSSMGLNASRLEEKTQAQWLMANALVEIKLAQFENFKTSPLNDSEKKEIGGREWYLFSKSSPGEYQNSVETVLNVCLDQQKNICVLEQRVFSSKKKLPLAAAPSGSSDGSSSGSGGGGSGSGVDTGSGGATGSGSDPGSASSGGGAGG